MSTANPNAGRNQSAPHSATTASTRPPPIVGPMYGTPEWDAMHVGPIIGASDAAAVCGRSRYQTPLDVFSVRTGRLKVEQTDAMAMGHYMEGGTLKCYEHATEAVLDYPVPTLLHPLYAAFMCASCDAREIVLGRCLASRFPGRPVEAKWSRSRAAAEELGEEGRDEIPEEWLFQVQDQLEVTDEPVGDIAVMLFGTLKIFTVRRNRTLGALIIEACREMSERIKNDDPPEPNWEHPHNAELIRQIHPVNNEVEITLSDEALGYWATYQDLGPKIKAMEAQRAVCQAHVLHEMADAANGLFPLGTRELHRGVVTEALVTEADVEALRKRVGQIKRKGYTKLTERKRKQ